jgi:hypothetical protein
MNISQNSQNPYVVGPPVYGKNFYGRSKELGKVLEGTKKFIWFTSTRRMGKTSLLAQIANLCQNEPKYNGHYRCLFWTLQGISKPDFKRLYKKLTLRINQPYIPEIDLMSLDSNQSCAQVIESCIEAVSQEGLTLLLLIDEPEVFLKLAEKEEIDFLDELLDCLQLQGIRTVITSTYRLYDSLASKNPLLAQFESDVIGTFNMEEGKALICQTNVLNQPPPFARDEQVINELLDKANYSPYFIQNICRYLYPDKGVTDKQIWDKIFDLRVFGPYFESDFKGLKEDEKAILYFMINKKENDLPASEIITGAKEIMPKGVKIIPTQRSLDVMTSLNILRHKNDNYYIANSFFRSWLLRDKDNLFCDIIQRRVLPSTPKEKLTRETISEIEININLLMNSLNVIKQEYDKGDLEFSRYMKMLFNYLTKTGPEIRKLITLLHEKGAGALADVVEKFLFQSQDDQELLVDLKHAAEEGELEGWGSIIHETLEREKHLTPQILILKVSIKVALFHR